jgi:hypothetical protein
MAVASLGASGCWVTPPARASLELGGASGDPLPGGTVDRTGALRERRHVDALTFRAGLYPVGLTKDIDRRWDVGGGVVLEQLDASEAEALGGYLHLSYVPLVFCLREGCPEQGGPTPTELEGSLSWERPPPDEIAAQRRPTGRLRVHVDALTDLLWREDDVGYGIGARPGVELVWFVQGGGWGSAGGAAGYGEIGFGMDGGLAWRDVAGARYVTYTVGLHFRAPLSVGFFPL